jgi:hypothetical protein
LCLSVSGLCVALFTRFFFFFFLLLLALGCGAAAGIIFGLILFFFPTIALFIVSLIIGFCLGILIYNIALQWTGWSYAYFVSVGVCGLLLPVIAICIKKPFIIVMTAFYGAIEICFGGNCFFLFFYFFLIFLLKVATFLPPGAFPVYVDPKAVVESPHYTVYIFFGAIIVGTILGTILQACVFARGITWDNVRKHVCPTARNERYHDDELGTPLMSSKK